ncbi:hypothetical protein F5Y18DRAFT_433051 [Xylariaceae sp. FL1019]|nr:hypothetical protein F5Y18DRAFT_433051 [Xylariaceae sp. FL1019]
MDLKAFKTQTSKAIDALGNLAERVQSSEADLRKAEKRIQELESRGDGLPATVSSIPATAAIKTTSKKAAKAPPARASRRSSVKAAETTSAISAEDTSTTTAEAGTGTAAEEAPEAAAEAATETAADTANGTATSETASFQCPHCDHKAYNNKKSMREHMELNHVGKQCHWNDCDHVASDEKALQAHLKEHQDKATAESSESNPELRCHWPGCRAQMTVATSAIRCVYRHSHKLNYASE